MYLDSPLNDRDLDRYRLRGERVVIAQHQHWAVLVKPILLLLLGLIVAGWVDSTAPRAATNLVSTAWLLWLAGVCWVTFIVWEWQRDWFFATNKRLLLFHGIPRKVAMMPLLKVTDMTYERTIPGLLFGYGRFRLESAGQDQALSIINFVVNPDTTYRIICEEIFGTTDPEDRYPPDHEAPVPPEEPPGPAGPTGADDGGPGPTGDPHVVRGGHPQDDAPHEIPTRPGSVYRSANLVQQDRSADTGPINRLEDTGPIPMHRPTRDR